MFNSKIRAKLSQVRIWKEPKTDATSFRRGYAMAKEVLAGQIMPTRQNLHCATFIACSEKLAGRLTRHTVIWVEFTCFALIAPRTVAYVGTIGVLTRCTIVTGVGPQTFINISFTQTTCNSNNDNRVEMLTLFTTSFMLYVKAVGRPQFQAPMLQHKLA